MYRTQTRPKCAENQKNALPVPLTKDSGSGHGAARKILNCRRAAKSLNTAMNITNALKEMVTVTMSRAGDFIRSDNAYSGVSQLVNNDLYKCEDLEKKLMVHIPHKL